MEMYVGFVDEVENEQGIVYMIEYVVFFGSKKCEKFLGIGVCLNVYIDFYYIVFYVYLFVIV